MDINSIFRKSQSLCIEDIRAAIATIEQRPPELNKALFSDMLNGFRVLLNSVEAYEPRAFETVCSWLQFYLSIQSNLQNLKLRYQYEKTVPAAVTYIIGCLQHKPADNGNFHFDLLSMTYNLLNNVETSTVEKLANFETGIIACLWVPIDFVGDFNTQMMALKLLVMLIKCVDDTKQQAEIEKIHCVEAQILRAKLVNAITVANYHSGVFENVARNLLNNYNMNLAKHILVYSLQCKTVRLGAQWQFFQPAKMSEFWIDLNYCPRTLTFSGSCKPETEKGYCNVKVALKVSNMTLQDSKLKIRFKPPAKFSKGFVHSEELHSVDEAEIELISSESERFKENDYVLQYYNSAEINEIAGTVSITESSDESDYIRCPDNLIAERAEEEPARTTQLPAATDQTFIIHSQASEAIGDIGNDTNAVSPIRVREPNGFAASYNLLIDTSSANEMDGENENSSTSQSMPPTTAVEFKVPSLQKYRMVLRQTKRKVISKEQPDTSITVSPLTSRNTRVIAHNDQQTVANEQHPIKGLREKRRFSKTSKGNPRMTFEGEQYAPRGKYKRLSKAKPMTIEEKINAQKAAPTQTPPTNVSASAAVFDQQRAAPAAVFSNFDVSDAEPCKSYRTYQTRRPPQPQTPKVSRPRRTVSHKAEEAPTSSRAAAARRTLRKRARNKRTAKSRLDTDSDCDWMPRNAAKRQWDPASQQSIATIDLTAGIARDIPALAVELARKRAETEGATHKTFALDNEAHNAAPNPVANNPINLQAFQQSEAESNNMEIFSQDDVVSIGLSPIDISTYLQTFRQGAAEFNIMSPVNDFALAAPTFLSDSSPEPIAPAVQRFLHSAGESPQLEAPHCDSLVERCLLYRERSECGDSSDSSDNEQNVPNEQNGLESQQENDGTFGAPATINVRNIETVTKVTSIITQHLTTHRRFSQDIVLRPASSSTNLVTATSIRQQQPSQSRVLVNYNRDPVVETPHTPGSLRQETNGMINAYRENLNDDLIKELNQAKEKCVTGYLNKVCTLTERILEEARSKRREMDEMTENVQRIVRQLDWTCEAYMKKSHNFECFKKNSEQLLNALRTVDIKQEVEEMFNRLLDEMKKNCNDIGAQQWKDFVRESTDHLLKNISSLSNL